MTLKNWIVAGAALAAIALACTVAVAKPLETFMACGILLGGGIALAGRRR